MVERSNSNCTILYCTTSSTNKIWKQRLCSLVLSAKFIRFCSISAISCGNYCKHGLSSYRSGCIRFRSLDDIFTLSALIPSETFEAQIESKKVERKRNVRFIAPLLEYGYRPAVEEYENQTLFNKPLLLYIPGFDGTFLSPFLQFPELHTIFDIRCMTIAQDDRSTLDELQSDIIQFLENECSNNLPISKSSLNLSNVTYVNLTGSKRKGIVKIDVARYTLRENLSVVFSLRWFQFY
jgi:hypothetical protein